MFDVLIKNVKVMSIDRIGLLILEKLFRIVDILGVIKDVIIERKSIDCILLFIVIEIRMVIIEINR